MVLKLLYHFLHVIVYLIAKLLFNYRAIGTEYIPKKGSAILASNHASYLDPPLVGLGVWRILNYLAKKELFENTLMNYILKNLLRAIPVDREQVDKYTLKKIYQLLRDNELLLMFPEGTRSYNGEFLPPKLGLGMIAYNARVPVIPVYIKGSYNILPRNAKMIRLKPCTVVFGPPVDLDPLYKQKKSKELYKEISVKIMENIKVLKQKTQEST
jgi:1-acyl-sn-glycerol-3-phosphate acyltransferase